MYHIVTAVTISIEAEDGESANTVTWNYACMCTSACPILHSPYPMPHTHTHTFCTCTVCITHLVHLCNVHACVHANLLIPYTSHLSPANYCTCSYSLPFDVGISSALPESAALLVPPLVDLLHSGAFNDHLGREKRINLLSHLVGLSPRLLLTTAGGRHSSSDCWKKLVKELLTASKEDHTR